MADSTKLIQGLKKAANCSKLGMRDLGPRSYKKGQGALLKAASKFSEDGTICKEKLEKVLDWSGKDVRHVAKKAERNGYVTIQDSEFKFSVSLTKKGQKVVEKRMEAEDKAADAILEALSDEERLQLETITEKICKTCEELGVDCSLIRKRTNGKKRKGHGHHHEGAAGCCHHHGHRHSHHHDRGPKAVIIIK